MGFSVERSFFLIFAFNFISYLILLKLFYYFYNFSHKKTTLLSMVVFGFLFNYSLAFTNLTPSPIINNPATIINKMV